jgi:hypothetical protein
VRAIGRVVIAVACLLGSIAPASAQGLIGRGWLERLSGPGPFKGWTLDYRFACLTAPGPAAEVKAIQDRRDRNSWADKLRWPDENDSYGYLSLVGCHFLDSDQPRLDFGLQFAPLHSIDNLLEYDDEPPLSDADKQVNIRMFMLTADIRVNRVLDVGAAIGRARFSPGGDAALFNNFSRTVTQPMRLTTRPLTVFGTDRRLEVLVVRFDATKFHGKFIDLDFGATAGTFSERGEIIWNWSILVDPTALFWR